MITTATTACDEDILYVPTTGHHEIVRRCKRVEPVRTVVHHDVGDGPARGRHAV
jgi:hypothetical protein